MNTFIKVAIASVLAIGAVSANAGIADPSLGNLAVGGPNNGQTVDPTLVLVVMDTTNGYSYARNTGLTIDSLFPSTNPGAASINLAADANMTTFLSHVAGGDSVSWALVGGYFGNTNYQDLTASGLAPTGEFKVLTTTPNPASVPNISLQNIGTLFSFTGGYQQFVSQLNTNLGTGSSVVGASAASAGVWDATLVSNSYATWTGVLANSISGFGTSAKLFGLTGNGGTNPVAGDLVNVSNLGSFTLTSAGLLTSAVPLPAAFWLFGSGLLGLAGVGRRKAAA